MCWLSAGPPVSRRLSQASSQADRVLSRKRRPALGSCPARGPGAGTGGSARQGHAETIRWSHHPGRPASRAGQGSDRGRMMDGPRCGGRAAGLGVPGLPTTPAHALGSEGPQCGPGKHRVEKWQCPPWAGRRGGAEMTGLLLAPGRASRGDRLGSGRCPAATAAPAGMARDGLQAWGRRSRRRAQQGAEGSEGHGDWGLLAAGGCGEPQGGLSCGCSQSEAAPALPTHQRPQRPGPGSCLQPRLPPASSAT